MIAGAGGNASPTPRWDRLDSRRLIATARRIYFQHLSDSGVPLEPFGVVVNIHRGDGHVVFESPTLLPEEQFIAAELIGRRFQRQRNPRDRQRGQGS